MADLDEELQRAEAISRRGRQLLDARGHISPEDADRWFSELVSSLEILAEEVNNPNCFNVMRQGLLARISVMVTLRSRIEDVIRSEMVGRGLGRDPERV